MAVAYRADAGRGVGGDRFAVAWRLGKPDRARNDCLEKQFRNMSANVLDDLLTQVGPHVEHRHEDSQDACACSALDDPQLVEKIEDFRKSLQCVIFALEWNENQICGGEGIGHQKAEGWRGVEQDNIVGRILAERTQGLPQVEKRRFRSSEFRFDRG